MQWGTAIVAKYGSTTTVTFPTPYSNTNYVVLCNFFQNANIDDDANPYPGSTTEFYIYGTTKGANDSWSNVLTAWLSIGY